MKKLCKMLSMEIEETFSAYYMFIFGIRKKLGLRNLVS